MTLADGGTWQPAQTVLVLQGGGALGAYHAGVYQGLHEAGIEPDWVIGTSIGAINGAIIAGNKPEARLAKLTAFWAKIGYQRFGEELWPLSALAGPWANLNILLRGIPGFFQANPHAGWGLHVPVGLDRSAFYSTAPLRDTLEELVDFDYVCACRTRLTVGAVNVRSSEMRYFDNRDMRLAPEHVMASGALPPAFPAVRVEGEPYWDGGIYSNTPVEVVLDDKPRRDSLIFSANVWQPQGAEPETIWQVLGRQKDIQYASRVKSHIMRQAQIHRLRHIVRQLAARLPEEQRNSPAVREMVGYGCHTTMHIVRLLAPRLGGEDHTKDIDFSRGGIRTRWQAGYADVRAMLAGKPWQRAVDPLEGVIVHESTDLERATEDPRVAAE
jgi:NTE family protein